MEAPLIDYDSRGLVNDFDYERLSPLWSPSGDKVLVPTALVVGLERSMQFRLALLTNFTTVQVFEDIEKIIGARWISEDRLIVEQESDTTGIVEISIYRIVG
jgi:hypothetical protein